MNRACTSLSTDLVHRNREKTKSIQLRNKNKKELPNLTRRASSPALPSASSQLIWTSTRRTHGENGVELHQYLHPSFHILLISATTVPRPWPPQGSSGTGAAVDGELRCGEREEYEATAQRRRRLAGERAWQFASPRAAASSSLPPPAANPRPGPTPLLSRTPPRLSNPWVRGRERGVR